MSTRDQSGVDYGENQSTLDPISRLGNSWVRRCLAARGLLRGVGTVSILDRASGVIAPVTKSRKVRGGGREGQGAITHPVSEESPFLGGPAGKGSGEGGFTYEGHPICNPTISALSTFRQHMSELSR